MTNNSNDEPSNDDGSVKNDLTGDDANDKKKLPPSPSPSSSPKAKDGIDAFTSPLSLFRPDSSNIITSPPLSVDALFQNDNVLLTPLSDIPGATIQRYLGPVQLHFIKDSWSIRDGPFDTFLHSFIAESNAIAKAQVAALGGNALICHRFMPQESGGRNHRNQAYNMFTITGDAVTVEFNINNNFSIINPSANTTIALHETP
jgi:uncharacterized protein YbjQ (UPF0145 family)